MTPEEKQKFAEELSREWWDTNSENLEDFLKRKLAPLFALVEAGQAMRKTRGPVVRCIGFPDCDGDLPGMTHSAKCTAARTPSSTEQWDAALANLQEVLK